jgi:hypothetical protein
MDEVKFISPKHAAGESAMILPRSIGGRMVQSMPARSFDYGEYAFAQDVL